ncbi:hypothetical protein PRIPAC_73923 [Pristionchus pacificus]|uniref:Uncharacterized protein n=1 Tax=Pristionchus pacificus TaxID=54126 RepID=A0A2A6BF47_PRIPA|nr:hypothetical protein PRIPAC_73923 [Pristionchus pacificus]|eukprot:PDM64488.1 hypothetical protein PRIPAC_52744 [Pristionchus pacificus]
MKEKNKCKYLDGKLPCVLVAGALYSWFMLKRSPIWTKYGMATHFKDPIIPDELESIEKISIIDGIVHGFFLTYFILLGKLLFIPFALFYAYGISLILKRTMTNKFNGDSGKYTYWEDRAPPFWRICYVLYRTYYISS